MRDPRSHSRYQATRRTWLPTAHPICCLCGQPVDLTLPATHRYGPTVEHTVPIRSILAMARSYDEALTLACDTTLWLLAHKRCQDRQGAAVTNARRRRGPRQPSRAW